MTNLSEEAQKAEELAKALVELAPFLASYGNQPSANKLLQAAEMLKLRAGVAFDAAIIDCTEYRKRWLALVPLQDTLRDLLAIEDPTTPESHALFVRAENLLRSLGESE